MGRRAAVSPSTQGVRPAMKEMYRGRGKTRPIPIIVDSAERRAIAASAADQKPKVGVVNMPMNRRVTGVSVIFGSVVGGAKVNGGNYKPAVGGAVTLGNSE